jgi:DNA topoisomerase-2
MIQSTAPDKKVVTFIDTTIDQDGLITITNDGNGIDVAKHPEYDLWIPEMVFGHLRTSTNYNKDEEKIVGGKNGYGVKLANIFGKSMTVETVDAKTAKKYTQTWETNMTVVHPPKIVASKVKPYVSVAWTPDLARFGLEGRHLRAFRSAAEREVGLFSQVVGPMSRLHRPTPPAAALVVC